MTTNGIGRLRRWLAGPLGLLGISFALCSAHAAPPPVEVFGNLPSYASLAISPSGRSLAWRNQRQARCRRHAGHRVGQNAGEVAAGSDGETHWLDDRARSRTLSLRKAFTDRDVRIIGHSEDFERVLAAIETPSTSPVYYFVDFKSGRADIVGEAYPALADANLGVVRSLSYSARDGATIPAYLTTPHGAAQKNLPLIVLPHGGPEARDYLEFDWLAQFLASRGYAVLQPQFRGSTGFGEVHRHAGYRQWGGLMQDDVTDGVKAMIEQGLADPGRICIVGAGYGGYAALAGAAFTPDLYVCAASINGVFDLPTYLSYHEQRFDDESDILYYWRDHIGPKLDPKVAERSPARAAATIRIPVLLLHGEDDTIIPFAQSKRMHEALEGKKPTATLVTLPGEDHWLSKAETRIRMLTELESFLAQHIEARQDSTSSAAAQ